MTIFDLNFLGIQISPSYYGLMYAISFITGYLVIKKRKIIKKEILDDLFFYIFLGVIFGGRLGYILFYDLSFYLNSPLSIFEIWKGGMSFHGGVIGVLIVMIAFSKKYKINFYKLSDEITAIIPIGIGLGRIGNYLNKELLGFSPYNGILAVYKKGIGYFPSPLVEAFLEGLVLFVILNIIYKKRLFDGQITSLFLIFYSVLRIIVEIFFREPDAHIGYIFGFLTMGEILSFPMLLFGVYFYFKLRK